MTGYSTFLGRGRGRGRDLRRGSSSRPEAGRNAANAPGATSATGSGPPEPKRQKTDDGFNPNATVDPYSLDKLPSSSPVNKVTFPTGPSNLGRPAQTGKAKPKSPAQDPFASTDVSDLEKTGIFNILRGESIKDVFEQDQNLPETPSKTNKHTLEQLQKLMADAIDDAKLLEKLRAGVEAARGNQTTEQRKKHLRKQVQPWIQTGLKSREIKRAGLFLEDGTRNPDRPQKGSGSRPPPGTRPGAATAGPGGRPSNAGKPSSDPVKAPTVPKAPPAADPTKKPSSATATKPSGVAKPSSATATNPSGVTKASSATATNPPKVTKALSATSTNPPKGGEPSSTTVTTSANIPKAPTTARTREKAYRAPAKSPLGKPPLTADHAELQNPEVRGVAGWQTRDDLFEAEVMEAAGLTLVTGDDPVEPLPQQPSSIDYDTENWE